MNVLIIAVIIAGVFLLTVTALVTVAVLATRPATVRGDQLRRLGRLDQLDGAASQEVEA